MAKKDTPEKALRYARYIVQDIEMYNQKRVEDSIVNDSFFEDLKDLFIEGKDQYESQVIPEILAKTRFFEQALVDVILYRKKSIDTPIWD